MPPHPDPSDRLRLDLALLARSEPPLHPPAAGEGRDGERIVLVASGDAELDGYIGECLLDCAGLAVRTPLPGESALEAERRLQPSLLIATPAALGSEPLPAPAPPLLLLVEEPADAAAWQRSPDLLLDLLVQPCNARRLRGAVERLLGNRDRP
jgi:hypothetical protein